MFSSGTVQQSSVHRTVSESLVSEVGPGSQWLGPVETRDTLSQQTSTLQFNTKIH